MANDFEINYRACVSRGNFKFFLNVHGKNNFVEVFKNLATNLKIILLDHQNNYVRYLSVDDNAAKSFNIPSISLNVL